MVTFPDRKDQIHNLALAYLFLNDYEKSAAIFEPFIKELETKGKEHYMNRVRNRYGYLLWKTGNKSEGIKQIKLSNEYFLRSIV